MDKIAVIIPVKNEEEKIERCLKVVFGQTVQPFEMIVIDGHSTDSTFEDTHTKHGSNDNLDLI